MTSPFASLAAKICGLPSDSRLGECPACAHPAPHATIIDSASMTEFKISGLCQQCQDNVFDPESLKP